MLSIRNDFFVWNVIRRVYLLLDKSERKKVAFIIVVIVVNSFIDILGLSAVLPLIGIIVEPELIQTNVFLAKSYESVKPFGIDHETKFLIFLSFLTLSAFVFKAIFGLTVVALQTRFSFSVAHRMAGTMWSAHFQKSLQHLNSSDSGRLISEINNWPLLFANIYLVGVLLILSEITIVSIIVLGLIFYNPLVILAVGCIVIGGTWIIRTGTNKRLGSYNQIRKALEPKSNRFVTDAIHGFLEVLSFQAEDSMKKAYLNNRKQIFRIQGNNTVLNQLPAKLFEVLAVAAIVISIVISIIQGAVHSEFISTLSLMALTAYRIMPSMSRINGAIINLRSNKYLVESVEWGTQGATTTEASEEGIKDDVKIDIDVHNLSFAYDIDNPLISNLTCSFNAGKIHAIVGASGNGKSTLLNLLLGLHHPQEGIITISSNQPSKRLLGQDISPFNWLTHCGYLSQSPFLFHGTVRQNLTLNVSGRTIDEPHALTLINRLKMTECLGETPLDFQLFEGGSNLSGGQRQRLALIRALIYKRPVLILDEATSALDSSMRDEVFQILEEEAQRGVNVIIVSHDNEFVKRCDTLLDLNDHDVYK